jgi:hypothetical protein
MNSSSQDSDLIIRLRKLEKSQARYRAAFLVTATLTIGLCVVGAKPKADDVIQAKTFEVVNDSNQVMARFTSTNGKGEFHTFRADGSPLVSIFSSDDDSGRLETYNAKGKVNNILCSSSTGSGSLVINNTLGTPAVQLTASVEKNGGMWVYNTAGTAIADVTASSGSSDGVIDTYDSTGKRTGHLP